MSRRRSTRKKMQNSSGDRSSNSMVCKRCYNAERALFRVAEKKEEAEKAQEQLRVMRKKKPDAFKRLVMKSRIPLPDDTSCP